MFEESAGDNGHHIALALTPLSPSVAD